MKSAHRVRRSGSRRAVGVTAILNLGMAASSATAGLIIARALGPAGRGEYAAVIAWFGIALVAGELGQPAAVCYFVASDRTRARDYVATSRVLMLSTGIVSAAVGWFISPLIGRHHSEVVACYRLMFATCIVSFVSASYVFALQAVNLRLWNIVRGTQPALYLVMVVSLHLAGRLTLTSVVVALVITVSVQALLSFWMCSQVDLTGGRRSRDLSRRLLRYGSSQLAANAPSSVNGRLDQLILSGTTAYTNLGLYAVAVSVTSLALPAVAAIGSVLFPRIAAQAYGRTQALERKAIRTSLVASTAIMVAVAAPAPWLIPAFFGTAFSGAINLVWILAVGGVFLGSGQVLGDLLRGRGQPLAVAVAQGVGAVLTIGLLLALLPTFGIRGAAVASTIAYAVTFGLLLGALRRPRPQGRAGPVISDARWE